MMWIITSAFLLGLISNIHCIAMCGPIVSIIPFNRSSKKKLLVDLFIYHISRILTYGVLGIVVGLIGFSFSLILGLQIMAFTTGVLLCFIAIEQIFKNQKQNIIERLFSIKLNNSLFSILRNYQGRLKIPLLGIFNGILPCSLVYYALFISISALDFRITSISMLAFGLGTFPLLFTYQLGIYSLPFNKFKSFQSLIPYLIILVGILTMLRGLNLDIPLVSPAINIEEKTESKTSNPTMEDCHK